MKKLLFMFLMMGAVATSCKKEHIISCEYNEPNYLGNSDTEYEVLSGEVKYGYDNGVEKPRIPSLPVQHIRATKDGTLLKLTVRLSDTVTTFKIIALNKNEKICNK